MHRDDLAAVLEYLERISIAMEDQAQASQRIAAQLERRDVVEQMRDALIWCSGSPSFAPEGEARKGWEKLCQPLIDGCPRDVEGGGEGG